MMDLKVMNGDLYKFVVVGTGIFPVELLCEEKCYPASKVVAKIIFSEHSLAPNTLYLESGNRPRHSVWRRHGWRLTVLSEPAHKLEANDFESYHTWPA